METIVLLVHGEASDGCFSHPKVRVIAKAGGPLSGNEVREYLRGASAPECTTSSSGSFSGLSDAQCSRDLGVIPGVGPGFVDSGRRSGGALSGNRVFVLRGTDATFWDIGDFARSYRKVILLPCSREPSHTTS
ncbi:hypothetical protein [Desulfoluna spongiiphila]|uniref:hypothetical protein n=1 Tax=Desulfoluna spongiiphila TaxID=419481 RepID=UPI0012544E1B|nr:hypothetical protein [Desulfoluna spongiiphila]VVS95084.1 hypothetical protein DBB_46610 [Desulfoluna spongiiphila]